MIKKKNKSLVFSGVSRACMSRLQVGIPWQTSHGDGCDPGGKRSSEIVWKDHTGETLGRTC